MKTLIKKMNNNEYIKINCVFRAHDLPKDIVWFQQKKQLPIYHIGWVDALGEIPIELKCGPVRRPDLPIDALTFTGLLIEKAGQLQQAHYLINYFKNRNIKCYVEQEL